MIQDYFFRGVTASFPSPLPPEEAAARLAAAAHRPLRPLFRQCLVGRVSVTKVTLYRHRPFFRNSFTPFFRGRFVRQATGSVLQGHFIVHWFVKVFLLIWYSLLAYTATSSLSQLAVGRPDSTASTPFAMIALGFAVFPVLLVMIGLAFGRSDADYISREIQNSIGNRGA